MSRGPERKFDWAEAQRRRADGETYTAIARDLGVSYKAVRFACDPVAREAAARRTKEWQTSGVCPDCGAPATRLRGIGQCRCRACAAKAQATSVRDGELLCIGCREWKPDHDFPHNRGSRLHRRGRHNLCRPCQTLAKRAYRSRVKAAA